MAWRSYILNNFWRKLLSVVLASLIWITVHFNLEGTLDFLPKADNPAPVEFANLPITVMTAAADIRGFKVSPTSVSVTLSGDPLALKSVRARDIQVYVNLAERKEFDGAMERIYVFPPPGTTVEKMFPPTVRVERVSP